MILDDADDPVTQDAAKLAGSLGYALVDLAVRKKDNKVMVSAILTGPEGFGIAECAKIHRLLMPRLEVLFDQKDVYLEVSSPGLERIIRHQREFEVFKGKKFKFLLQGASEWVRGTLLQVTPDSLEFLTAKETVKYDRRQVVKARLDMLGEVEANVD